MTLQVTLVAGINPSVTRSGGIRTYVLGYRYSAPSEVVCGHVRACAIATPPLRKILGLVIAVVAGGWVSGKNG